ncbi:hypothetical protein [Melaminivora sp.]|uniref:hypothetical protein n=1 Tax=Melaminivora sp. TaxID=1933032 RepID=UPI0028B04485|nr:hypothetical protein [Melaminivora sp.]
MTSHTPNPDAPDAPDWSAAPEGWNWLAQDADGRWFWYRTQPQLGWAGGVWRSNSRNQQLAGEGAPSADWADSLQTRPDWSPEQR